jgi:catechol 2,3-dioxygenase-like lactoylglutathione lyase family enzyme
LDELLVSRRSAKEDAMTDPNFVILYVKDTSASAAFYADVLGRAPAEASPTFVMFALSSGVMLGLWLRENVAPAVTASPGGAELAITLADADAVRAMHADWSRRKLPIAQAPTTMDFGYTFVALDPDGHRLRVFAPAAP